MKTNLEKYNHYMNLISKRDNDFIKLHVPVLPKKMFAVSFAGVVSELEITEASIQRMFNGRYIYLSPSIEKPTNKDIEKVVKYLEEDRELTKEDILFAYKERGIGYISSGCFHPFKNDNPRSFVYTSDEANRISAVNTMKHSMEQEFKETHKKDASYNYATNGYKFLGWQNSWQHVYFDKDGNQTDDPAKKASFGYPKEAYPEYRNCIDQKHQRIEVSHNSRGSENTVSCPICKIYWKYDSSD